jgi:hypothetical protein
MKPIIKSAEIATISVVDHADLAATAGGAYTGPKPPKPPPRPDTSYSKPKDGTAAPPNSPVEGPKPSTFGEQPGKWWGPQWDEAAGTPAPAPKLPGGAEPTLTNKGGDGNPGPSSDGF